MDSPIAERNQKLSTAEEMTNQTKIVMQPYANWEEYLTPAPLSIVILGELVVVSSNTDFPINKNPPTGGYKYIRCPDSFRACLMQVCNTGWRAFDEAHKNMDQIRFRTLAVPNYMKTAMTILFNGYDEITQTHLPYHLESICVIADDCVKLATTTKNIFTYVLNTVYELLEACINAEFFYGKELDAIKKKLDEARLRKQSSEEAAKRSENAVKLMGKQLEEAHESYNKAMDSIPSGWEMIGMDLAEGITDGLTSIINGVTAMVSENQKTGSVKGSSKIGSKESSADLVDEIYIYSKSAEILIYTENIQGFIKENAIIWKDLYDQQHKTTQSNIYANQFKRIKLSLTESPACTAKSKALTLCESGIEICDELGKYAPKGKCEEAKTKELIERIRILNESARCFDSKSKNASKTAAVAPKLPMMYEEGSKSEKKRTLQKASENARFKIEQSRAQIDKTSCLYEKSGEIMEKNQKELTDVLVIMRNCDAKKIDFKTTIEMLMKGMDAMGRVKEQWEKMVHFFQIVSNIVKISLTRTLKNVISTSEKTQNFSYNLKLFSKDMLHMQVFQATNIVSLVHMISTTYTEVSTKHIMDHVSALGNLMTMDMTKPELLFQMERLQNACDRAQKAISFLVFKNKEEFKWQCRARQKKIDKELLAILPAADPEEEKSIRKAVKSGFKDEEEDDYT